MKLPSSPSISRPARTMIAMIVFAAGLAAIGANLSAQPKTAAPAPAPAETAQQPGSAQDMTMLELFAKGGFFMWPILACSLIAVTVIIERFISLRRRAVIPPDFMENVRRVYRTPADREKALEYCRSQNTPIARIVAAAIGKLHRGPAAVEKIIEEAGANEVSRLRKNFRTIYSVASIAPLLGLIGTISGMIKAFQVTSDVGTGAGKALATGIYEALVTTYAGLLVAIPTLAFYHYLQGRVERLVSEMNEVCTTFIEHYVDTPGTVDIASPPRVDELETVQ